MELRIWKFRVKLRSPVVWLLTICLAVSVISLIVYLAEVGFQDNVLFVLLAVIRYSSFLGFVCSLYKFLECIYVIVRFKRKSIRIRFIRRMIIFLIIIIYFLFIFYFNAFITVFAGGNG